MLNFISFAFSYTVIQSFPIFISIAIFALITKKLYVKSNIYKRLLHYSVIGTFFGMWSFFSFDNIPFISLGLIKTSGMVVVMTIYSAVIISPFVLYSYKKKK